MATFYIDPSAAKGGTGSQSKPFNSWSQVTVKAGNTYLQRAGTTATGVITLSARGTAASPIQIGSYGTGAAPTINGSLNLNGAAYVTVSGFTIRNGSSAGAVLVQGGAHHITLRNNTLTQSQVGVWMGNGAGADNVIERNTITDNTIFGIAADNVDNPAGHATRIANNTIARSGSHGIELNGNNFIVSGNTVSDSGLTIPGSSGIHVYGDDNGVADGYGVGNSITGNVVHANRDGAAYDGNGIQLDTYTHGNTVTGNFATGNDGAGIILWDSYGNTVSNNTADANARDAGGTHVFKGEFILGGMLDLTRDNLISGNVGLATQAPAVLVDALTADNPNRFSGNVWQNTTGGPDTMLGTDSSWAAWLAYDLLGGAGLVPDAETGVPLTLAPYAGTLAYSFAAGTTQTIDGTAYRLLGWSGTQLVVTGEGVV